MECPESAFYTIYSRFSYLSTFCNSPCIESFRKRQIKPPLQYSVSVLISFLKGDLHDYKTPLIISAKSHKDLEATTLFTNQAIWELCFLLFPDSGRPVMVGEEDRRNLKYGMPISIHLFKDFGFTSRLCLFQFRQNIFYDVDDCTSV